MSLSVISRHRSGAGRRTSPLNRKKRKTKKEKKRMNELKKEIMKERTKERKQASKKERKEEQRNKRKIFHYEVRFQLERTLTQISLALNNPLSFISPFVRAASKIRGGMGGKIL